MDTLEKLYKTLEDKPEILAAWLGGSAATKRMDQFSDTDLVLISTDKDLPFHVIENSLPNISHRWIVKDGPYHQRFYVLEDTSETYYLDIVVFAEKDPHKYKEYFNLTRHGRPQIIFDKELIMERASKLPHSETTVLDPQNEQGKAEIIYRTFLKEKLRGKFIDGFSFYYKLVLIYTNIKRSIDIPERHDFNLRYIYSDLPNEASYIESLLKVSDLETMFQKAQELKEKIDLLLKEKL